MMVRTGWQLGDAIVLAYRGISLRWGGEELRSLRWCCVCRANGFCLVEERRSMRLGAMRDWAEVNRS